ncbi:hypothetical protein H072_3009 [Dactylellina haptotyla CBS 200.50]|uniref:SnoaL-like domain-containing protein n=1 Tax=Dactylellina haptotyla (strain CBS 200.50) TaxID=1284197 RepID=S8C5P3_DACHA|nr:hypothetical protein H072_3009 [Dactylellina haptotyla CBS 200.50]
MTTRRLNLLHAAKSLCDDFAKKAALDSLLSHFSSSATAFEHGDTHFAPFIGRQFDGLEGITEYFGYLQKYLTYSDMTFSEYTVDEDENKVSVKGKAKFIWLATSVAWSEVFTYTLDFGDEKGQLKVTRYQVWADTGALYFARLGRRLEDISLE